MLCIHRSRVHILAELEAIREELWPRLDHHHARRPAPDGRPCVRPLPTEHLYLWGRRLRSTCLAILRRHGRLALADLHSLLHLYGYGVASNAPVKSLADAMGHEVDKGHARRVERGVYELHPDFRPRPGRLGDPDSLGPEPTHDWAVASSHGYTHGGAGDLVVDEAIREDPADLVAHCTRP